VPALEVDCGRPIGGGCLICAGQACESFYLNAAPCLQNVLSADLLAFTAISTIVLALACWPF